MAAYLARPQAASLTARADGPLGMLTTVRLINHQRQNDPFKNRQYTYFRVGNENRTESTNTIWQNEHPVGSKQQFEKLDRLVLGTMTHCWIQQVAPNPNIPYTQLILVSAT